MRTSCTTEAQKIATSCRKTPRQWMWWLSILHRLRNVLPLSWPPLHYVHAAPSPANNPEPVVWDPPTKDFNTVQRTWLKCLHLLVQCISILHHQTGLVLQIQRSFPSHSSYKKGPVSPVWLTTEWHLTLVQCWCSTNNSKPGCCMRCITGSRRVTNEIKCKKHEFSQAEMERKKKTDEMKKNVQIGKWE